MKKSIVLATILALMCVFLGACGSIDYESKYPLQQDEYDILYEKYTELEEENERLMIRIDELESLLDSWEAGDFSVEDGYVPYDENY